MTLKREVFYSSLVQNESNNSTANSLACLDGGMKLIKFKNLSVKLSISFK